MAAHHQSMYVFYMDRSEPGPALFSTNTPANFKEERVVTENIHFLETE